MAEQESNNRLDASLLALYFTSISYAAAFAFDAAYLDHFGVPSKFASVELRNLLICGAAFLGLFAIIQNLLLMWPAHLPFEVQMKVIWFVAYIGIYCVGAWMAEGGLGWWLSIALFGALWIWLSFLRPIYLFRGLPTYTEKLVASYRANRPKQPEKDNAMDVIARKVGPKRFAWFGAGFGMVFISALLGVRTARNETAFFVIDNCAVLKQDADDFLCAELDGKIVIGIYRYVPLSGSQPVLMKVGPLRNFDRTRAHR